MELLIWSFGGSLLFVLNLRNHHSRCLDKGCCWPRILTTPKNSHGLLAIGGKIIIGGVIVTKKIDELDVFIIEEDVIGWVEEGEYEYEDGTISWDCEIERMITGVRGG